MTNKQGVTQNYRHTHVHCKIDLNEFKDKTE